MRRALVVVILVLGCSALFAAPAAAQRDPFQPPAGQGDTQEAPGGSAPQAEPAPAAPPATQSLANTGLETAPWLAIAYGLIAAGAGFVALDRLARPVPFK